MRIRKYISRRQSVPTIIIPYQGPLLTPGAQDVFLYLRPETNGVLAESVLLTVARSERFCTRCSLVYLANMPGDFVVRNRIIEQHYALKIKFARCGGQCFTQTMQKRFESYFNVPFGKADIIGAFPALRRLGMSDEELFRLRVEDRDYTYIHGQSIKKYGDCYIVNYDIPAVLHKNSRATDFAVMIFRSLLNRNEFHAMVEEMGHHLIAEKVVPADRPLARTFHYSSGPFEQILDGIGYLFTNDGIHHPLDQLSFFAYLMENGIHRKNIMRSIRSPIMQFRTPDGDVVEENLFTYTMDESYPGALAKLRQQVPDRS